MIGSNPQGPLQKFLTELPQRFTVAEGRAELNGVIVRIEGGRAVEVERYRFIEEI